VKCSLQWVPLRISRTCREAKEFLISRIVAGEAQLENVLLSERCEPRTTLRENRENASNRALDGSFA
jgi:hypothetical protein